ncbi:TCR/Tet family MFS transporter [Deinococcus sp. Arct2-2]|uniref:TCR/Tet family MFS transporter n=1 Tax=Deinococcus sp. Arct2-2 TaxID=2568653 RepID=UPI0010A34DF8|nr:TCR/Tet family MFS transporter [Deinococcus sp. Arct2-2]THF67931.1 TCR/Tet family MFS transporter [Deinococcus sp. Arct2-2]
MSRKLQAGIGFIFITVIIDALGVGLIIPVLPRVIESFGDVGLSQASSFYGLLIALYSLMAFLFAGLMGSLSDRFGRRPVLLLSLLGLGLDYVIIALAPNLSWLIVGRVLAGIFGASQVTALAYIADVSPPQDRAKNFGLIGAAFGLGFIIGPLLGGVLGGIELRLPFWVAAGLSLLNVLYGLLVLPESLPPERRQPFRWSRANPVGSLMALRRTPSALTLTAVYGLTRLSLNGLIAVWVLYTGFRLGWNVTQIGLSLAFTGICLAVVQGGMVGPVVARLGEVKTTLLGLTLSTLAYVLFGLFTTGWMLYAAIVLSASGGLVAPTLQGMISSRVPPTEQGLLQGALASLNNLANVVAPPVVAGLFAYVVSPSVRSGFVGTPLFLCALVEGSALLVTWVAFRRLKPPADNVNPSIPHSVQF